MKKRILLVILLFLCITSQVFSATSSTQVLMTVYDGENSSSDANFSVWSGNITLVDVPGGHPSGFKQGQLTIISNLSSGIQVPDSSWWEGKDATIADSFHMFYHSPTQPISARIVSYDPYDGLQYSKTISLPITTGMKKVFTNLTALTQGLFNLKKIVGVELRGANPCTAWIDNIQFTSFVYISDFSITPFVITNNKNNVVQFTVKATTGNSYISNVRLNLSAFSNIMTNVMMTNISGKTLWRYSYLVKSNTPVGIYSVTARAIDNLGFSSRNKNNLMISGRTPFVYHIVYDGDAVHADADQWLPGSPPITSFFQDVNSGVTAPHLGNKCGSFQDTNPSPSPGKIFHWSTRSPYGLDISSASRLDVWAKGLNSPGILRIQPWFLGDNSTLIPGNNLDINYTQNWQNFFFTLSSLTNGRSIGSAVKKFTGISLEYLPGYTPGTTVFLDDVTFTSFVRITNQKVITNIVDKDKNTAITFFCKAQTKFSAITSCTIDLSPIGGSKTAMSNISNMTSFRYTYSITSNMLLSAGLYKIPIKAHDNQGNSGGETVYLTILSSRMEIKWDFETNMEFFSDNTHVDGGVNQLTYHTICNWGIPSKTNWWSYSRNNGQIPVIKPKHGTGVIGCGWNLDYKWLTGVDVAGPYYKAGNFAEWGTYTFGDNCSTTEPPYANEKGWVGWFYVDPAPGLEPDDTFQVMGFGMWGGGWETWRGGSRRNIMPGRWNKAIFNLADSFGSGPYPATGVVTRRLGWRVYGAFSGTGSTIFHMDYITLIDSSAPPSPDGLSIQNPGLGGTLDISWNPVPVNDIEKYNIYQSTNANFADANLICSVNTNYFRDAGVKNGSRYYYWISAVDYSENESPKTGPVSGTASGGMPSVLFPYKGVVLLSTNAGEFQNPSILTVLTNIKKTGANIVSIPITWCQNSWNSSSIYSNADGPGRITLPDSDLRSIIAKVTNMGMNVMLQLELQSEDNTNISKIMPTVPGAWFSSYNDFIMKYATIASQYNCSILSIGSRLYSLATPAYDGQWSSMISSARLKFKNKITFSSVWGSMGVVHTYTNKEMMSYKRLTFWDDLDIIGIEAYWPLSYSKNAVSSALLEGWNSFTLTNDENGWNNNALEYQWYENLVGWLNRKFPGKEVIFTKVGYPSSEYAGRYPWSEGTVLINGSLVTLNADTQAQANGYEAMFRKFWNAPWLKGTFCNYFSANPPGLPNTKASINGKPAYETIKSWYTPRPQHFEIQHDGVASIGKWEPIIIRVHTADHTIFNTYTGILTLNINKGTGSAIAWTNLGSCGSLIDYGAGTPKAVFTFTLACNGIVTLGIKDNTMETVSVKLRSDDGLSEIASENPNLVVTGPLSHFIISHDGIGVKNRWKKISIQPIDPFGNVKLDYEGAVTVWSPNTIGNLQWKAESTNSTFATNGGGFTFTFRKSDLGIFEFSLKDNTVETLDIDAHTTIGNYHDQEPNFLRIIDFSHFVIQHDGSALLNEPEKIVIKAVDSSNKTVPGINGNITISLVTNTIKAKGNIFLNNISGTGLLTNLSPRKWVYHMTVADAGTVTLSIIDNTVDTLDLKASDGVATDNDWPYQYLVFNTHLYHFVKKTPPYNPISPYITPETAATNILDAFRVSSQFDTILILDKATYHGFSFPSTMTKEEKSFRTISGLASNMPCISNSGAPAVAVEADWSDPYNYLNFRNIRFFANNSYCYSAFSAISPQTNIFINCTFSNTGSSPLVKGDGLYPTYKFYNCHFKGSGRFNDGNLDNIDIRYSTLENLYDGISVQNNARFHGNIVRKISNPSGGLLLFGELRTSQYNTIVFNSGSAFGPGNQVFGASNNIIMSNGSYGIAGWTGWGHDYNSLYKNSPNFQGTSPQPQDVTNQYPQFVNTGALDFRLKADSPFLNNAFPNPANGVRGPRGAHTWSIKTASKLPNTVTSYTLTWVPILSHPLNMAIKLKFPSKTDVSGITGITSTMDGSFSWSGSQSNLIIRRKGSSFVTPLRAERLIINGIRNPQLNYQYYSIEISTHSDDSLKLEGDEIEYPRLSNCYEIESLGLTENLRVHIIATNITLNGSSSLLVPGATVSMKLTCSNISPVIATKPCIYVPINISNSILVSNSIVAPGGWIIEYSTNQYPNQAWDSIHYTTNISFLEKTRWVRWKNQDLAALSHTIFSFKVRIK